MPNIIESAMHYVQDLFYGRSDGHGYDHSFRVYQLSMSIAASEPACDFEITALAALLHDADDEKMFQTIENANTRLFLSEHSIYSGTADRICSAINAVSFKKNGIKRPETLEGQIVQDADRLEAIGAVGIARTFSYGGFTHRSLESSINHFYEKLLLLKDGMNTAKGKELAEIRHEFLLRFLQEWEKETRL